MSRFGEGLRIVPRTAWAIAVFFYLVMSNLAFFVLTASDKEMRKWPVYGRALLFIRHFPADCRVDLAGRLCLRRCQEAWNALRHVDVAGCA